MTPATRCMCRLSPDTVNPDIQAPFIFYSLLVSAQDPAHLPSSADQQNDDWQVSLGTQRSSSMKRQVAIMIWGSYNCDPQERPVNTNVDQQWRRRLLLCEVSIQTSHFPFDKKSVSYWQHQELLQPIQNLQLSNVTPNSNLKAKTHTRPSGKAPLKSWLTVAALDHLRTSKSVLEKGFAQPILSVLNSWWVRLARTDICTRPTHLAWITGKFSSPSFFMMSDTSNTV